MSQEKYILALDEGTTSAKATIYDHEGAEKGRGTHEITQIFPRSGWVEHDPDEIWRAQMLAIKDAMRQARIRPSQLEAIAFQTRDVIEFVEADVGAKIRNLRVDGGGSANDFLMQFQADILNTEIVRPSLLETTSLGAGFLAGLATGYWKNTTEIAGLLKIERIFKPRLGSELRQKLYENWTEAVKRASKWALTLNKTEAHV